MEKRSPWWVLDPHVEDLWEICHLGAAPWSEVAPWWKVFQSASHLSSIENFKNFKSKMTEEQQPQSVDFRRVQFKHERFGPWRERPITPTSLVMVQSLQFISTNVDPPIMTMLFIHRIIDVVYQKYIKCISCVIISSIIISCDKLKFLIYMWCIIILRKPQKHTQLKLLITSSNRITSIT